MVRLDRNAVKKTWVPVTAGALVGFALWLGSWELVGSPHPFEAKSPIILGCLFVAGGFLGAGWTERLWAGPLGLYLGQAAALLVQSAWLKHSAPAEPVPLALLFLVQYCLPSLAGAGLGALLMEGAAGNIERWLSGRRQS
jgi:hypothetical protein